MKSPVLTQELIDTCKALIDFNSKNGSVSEASKSVMSIINSPTGETIVIVKGNCVACLNYWFNEHAEEVLTSETIMLHEVLENGEN